MTLTNAEILALAVPIAGAVMAFVVAYATRVSVRRRRRRLEDAHRSAAATAGDDDLLEIKPELLMRAQGGDRPRYFVRAGALRALVAHNEAAPRANAAE
jgi:hypothetical protein